MKIIVHLSFWNNISERENGLAQRKNTEIFFIHKKTVHKKTKRTSNILRLRNFVKRLIDSEIVLFFCSRSTEPTLHVPRGLVSQTSEGLNFSFGFLWMILLVTKTTSHEKITTKTHELEIFLKWSTWQKWYLPACFEGSSSHLECRIYLWSVLGLE